MAVIESTGDVHTVSRRLVRPVPASSLDTLPPSVPEVMHLTPWDVHMLTMNYVQKGILLPKPQTAAGGTNFIDDLASSLARTLGRFYPLAGRLTAAADIDATAGTTTSFVVSLSCNGEGAEFIHAVAPGVTTSDITTPVYVPPVVRSFFPLNGVLSVDAVVDSRPVLAAQVTELQDGVFIAVSVNHAVADGATFWHLMNTWSEISRRRCACGGDDGEGYSLSTPPPVLDRWFDTSSPVPIPLRFDQIRRPSLLYYPPPLQKCFFQFSGESTKKLKAKANAEVATTTITISSLQALLAHAWRGLCRARQHSPDRETTYVLLVGCRAPRVKGIPEAYMGNAVMPAVAKSSAGDILGKGLGWTALLLNRAVASFDEARIRGELAAWQQNPDLACIEPSEDSALVVTGSSPRFDMYGNDFGWGRPVAVRGGDETMMDGKVTALAGRGSGGSVGMEVCLTPKALARLLVDDEFMEAASPA